MTPARSALAALLALGLAACDSAGLPEPYNPYDPAYDGYRTATAPDGLSLTRSTSTSVTLSWTDRSSFESGVRVERAAVWPGELPRFETVATLPPDATTYTDDGLTDTTPRRYRVVALVDGGNESVPSGPVDVRYPADTLALDALSGLDLSGAQVGPDGERLYLFLYSQPGSRVVDLRTGGFLSMVPNRARFVAFLDGGRLAFAEPTSAPYSFALRVFDGSGGSSVSSYGFPTSGCGGFSELRVSASGTRAAAFCRGLLYVWDAPGPAPSRTLNIGPSDSGTPLHLSPDGSLAYVRTSGSDPFSESFRAYSTESGVQVWRYNYNASSPTARYSLDGSTLAAALGGRMTVLDARTGAVRFTDDFSGVSNVLDVSADRGVGGYSTYFGSQATAHLRVIRTEGSALVRTVTRTRATAVRLVPGGLVVFEGATASSAPRAIRWDFGASWEAAPARTGVRPS